MKEQIKWFQLIEKIKNGTKSDQQQYIQIIFHKISSVKLKIEKNIQKIFNYINKNLYPATAWKECVNSLRELIGIERIFYLYESCLTFKSSNDLSVDSSFFHTQTDVIRMIFRDIENKNHSLVLSSSFGNIRVCVTVVFNENEYQIDDSKYIINNEEYVPKSSEKRNEKDYKNEYKGYKAFFDEMMDIFGMNRDNCSNDPSQMKLLAKQLMNSKNEIVDNSKVEINEDDE